MNKLTIPTLLVLLLAGCTGAETPESASATSEPAESTATAPAADAEGWITLFDGETLDGWTASENPESFSVTDGRIVVDGPRGHLFYTGPVEDHTFTNFEFRAEVMTMPGANSGIYIHTEYQDEGWPEKGYEVQVNNTHQDPRKTGGLYGIDDVMDTPPAADSTWFTEHIIVMDSTITTIVDGDTLVTYVEPADAAGSEERDEDGDGVGRWLSSGTVALQAHDPESVIYYRNIQIKPLP